MTVREFSLAPYPGREAPAIAVVGAVERVPGALTVRYDVRGALADVSLPATVPRPARKDRLWEETCLELFFAADGSGRYWELNLSPSGCWNLYRFDAYREGMREEPSVGPLPVRARREGGALRLSAELPLAAIVPKEAELALGIAAVVRAIDGGTSHWALAHPGPRPDFHRKDGFVLTLPGCDL